MFAHDLDRGMRNNGQNYIRTLFKYDQMFKIMIYGHTCLGSGVRQT